LFETACCGVIIMKSLGTRALKSLGQSLVLTAALFPSASVWSLTGGPVTTATTGAFASSGTFSGAGLNGVLIAPNWVLTARHVALGLTVNSTQFLSSTGPGATIDGIYYPNAAANNAVLEDDLALLHLSSSLNDIALPTLNQTTFTDLFGYANARQGFDLTLTSMRAGPVQFGESTVAGVITSDGTYTYNFIESSNDPGNVALEGGDSGSPLYAGTVSNAVSNALVGVASGVDSSYSYFVQPAAYKSWIDNTLAVTGDGAQWGAVQPVPEPSTLVTFGVGGVLLLMAQAWRRRAQQVRSDLQC
jgi:hypothetical protein